MNIKPIRIKQSDNEVRLIGHVLDDVFITIRKEQLHMYRGGKGITYDDALANGTASWGIDAYATDALIKQGVNKCKIISDKAVYTCSLIDFKEHDMSFVYHYRPYRPQYFLKLQAFNIISLNSEDESLKMALREVT